VSRITKILTISLALAAILVVSAPGAVSAAEVIDEDIDIVVSPNVLNVEAPGGSMSIHTNYLGGVPAEDITFTVDDVEITDFYTKVDDNGQLVVKCGDRTEVESIVTVGQDAEFVITFSREFVEDSVEYTVNYSGTDNIPVISVIPKNPN